MSKITSEENSYVIKSMEEGLFLLCQVACIKDALLIERLFIEIASKLDEPLSFKCEAVLNTASVRIFHPKISPLFILAEAIRRNNFVLTEEILCETNNLYNTTFYQYYYRLSKDMLKSPSLLCRLNLLVNNHGLPITDNPHLLQMIQNSNINYIGLFECLGTTLQVHNYLLNGNKEGAYSVLNNAYENYSSDLYKKLRIQTSSEDVVTEGETALITDYNKLFLELLSTFPNYSKNTYECHYPPLSPVLGKKKILESFYESEIEPLLISFIDWNYIKTIICLLMKEDTLTDADKMKRLNLSIVKNDNKDICMNFLLAGLVYQIDFELKKLDDNDIDITNIVLAMNYIISEASKPHHQIYLERNLEFNLIIIKIKELISKFLKQKKK